MGLHFPPKSCVEFFPVQYPLPPAEMSVLAEEFDKRFEELYKSNNILENKIEQDEFNKAFSPLWQTHIRMHLANLRRIQLFFNRISASISPVARDVNLLDFCLLELIRDSVPAIFLEIYRNGRYFYYPTWRVSTWGESLSLDEDEATNRRKAFFESFFEGIPSGKRASVSAILTVLFPVVRQYLEGRNIGRGTPSQDQSEKDKKIYHPDFFPRYFVSRVPSSQFNNAEMESFRGELRKCTTVEECAGIFQRKFSACSQPALKRWHFLDQVNSIVDTLSETEARGVGLGVGQISKDIQRDDLFNVGEWSRARAIIFQVAHVSKGLR